MNSKIGRNNQYYERIVMGKYAIGERNDKGERRCNICHNNKLVITESTFQHKEIYKILIMDISRRKEWRLD